MYLSEDRCNGSSARIHLRPRRDPYRRKYIPSPAEGKPKPYCTQQGSETPLTSTYSWCLQWEARRPIPDTLYIDIVLHYTPTYTSPTGG
ncbi:hypothetical protein AVEN_224704-1 [Araneus ventricosus]|uniref:Uncharacterized protein n=1 Tax=Araneus ventricosus TaxID=182803 RepID=A0A4Y2EUY1_ARAVE|nr:hypothetical protein AVEN_224704-1 [Araneus ventricosus]